MTAQIALDEILSQKTALAPYLKAISRMYDDLGGCVEELETASGSGGCFALFHIVRMTIVAVVIVEQVHPLLAFLRRHISQVPIELLSIDSTAIAMESESKDEGESQRPHLCLSKDCELCPSTTLGIRQMWARSDHRGRGAVFSLVELARKKTFPRLVVSRAHVAFSQPTEEGKRFIARYGDWPRGTGSCWVYGHRPT
jgi:hypothetical protein